MQQLNLYFCENFITISQVYVWSVSSSEESDPLVGSSAMSGHRERVTSVRWMPQEDNSIKHAGFLTGGLDGKIILWGIDSSALQRLKPVRVFPVLAEHLPRSLKVSLKLHKGKKRVTPKIIPGARSIQD